MSDKQNLCQACREISLQRLIDSDIIYHLSREDLLASATVCPMCRLLLDGLRNEYAVEYHLTDKVNSPNAFDNYTPTFQGIPLQWERAVTLSLKPFIKAPIVQRPQTNLQPMEAVYFAWANKSKDLSKMASHPRLEPISSHLFMSANEGSGAADKGVPVNAKPTTDDKINKIRSWLEADGRKAKQISASVKSTDHQTLPTRLIDVSRDINSLDDKVKLIETKPRGDHSEGLEYVTLSHRWGNSQCLTTTKETLASHLNGIEIADLPGTFQDAVLVCRQLQIRYLWIDALCIIQKDKDDWEKEGSIMGDIYKHSLMTIAVHSAANDQAGFLQSSLAGPISIRLNYDNSKPESQSEEFFLSSQTDFTVDINSSELSRRAWVLQERLLSERIVHFTTSRVYWESISEFGTRADNDAIVSDDYIVSRPKIPREPLQMPQSPLMWFDIVEQYTACGLTNPDDKLVAIAGLARHFQQCTTVGYLAGIWVDRLAAGLLWAAKKGMQKVETPRAPSWSWAALEGPVAFPISIARHEYGRQRPDLTPAVSLVQPMSGIPMEGDAYFLNGPGTLKLNAVVRPCMLSNQALSGRIAQKVPYFSHQGRLEPVADVAKRLGLGTVRGTVEELSRLRVLGYQLVTVAEDPQLNEETLVRYIVDESGNGVGWAALDTENGASLLAPRVTSGSSIEVFQMHSCIKVATYTDELNVKGTFVLIVLPKPGGQAGEWFRIGMGLVRGEVYFGGLPSTVFSLA